MFESYFITPESWQTLGLKEFKERFKQVLKTHSPSLACLRQVGDRSFSPEVYAAFVCLCKDFKVGAYVNLKNPKDCLDCALRHGFQGVHLKSKALDFAPQIPTHLQSFYSAHSTKQVQKALDLGVDFCTLSPLFATPNKPPPLGLDYFNALSPTLKAHIFALGGIISSNEVELVKNLHIKGFASIRYFLNP
ncbi:hypothetical protein NHP190003_14740 [Helicobacter sp. NHP19-003]|uniref:Thiamine phosphate synthase/TenI domain-containing protein n=1 Tax=Helicobacter gastrocanis TaxID=2849641 RepID=A0ABM7SED9_9HELI|nr:thiamine phosphate synthase [Helicobacter sp. NHP19-003]BCZ18192.1 hypothetical protein NHP190003_14740 [Helicobacter sp. NHP19-003]